MLKSQRHMNKVVPIETLPQFTSADHTFEMSWVDELAS